jgi:hypothetical protein
MQILGKWYVVEKNWAVSEFAPQTLKLANMFKNVFNSCKNAGQCIAVSHFTLHCREFYVTKVKFLTMI